MRSRRPNQRGFFWLAVLLAIPIAVLGLVGAVSLRTDRAVTETEAKERAQLLAGQAAHLVAQDWTEYLNSKAFPSPSGVPVSPGEIPQFVMSRWGDLISPPPIAEAQAPDAADRNRLSEDQSRLWETARAREADPARAPSAIAAYDEFLGSNPPEEFAARAVYASAVLLQPQNAEEAARRFETLRSTKYLSDAGLPLSQLAAFKWNELRLKTSRAMGSDLEKLGPDLSALAGTIVAYPHALSEVLLNSMQRWEEAYQLKTGRVKHWREIWAGHEKARALHRTLTNALHLSQSGVIEGLQLESAAATKVEERDLLRERAIAHTLILKEAPEQPVATPAGRGIEALYFWFDGPAGKWLAALLPSRGNYRVICRPELELRRRLESLIAEKANPPEYFGVGIDLAGHTLLGARDFPRWREVFSGGKGTSKRREELDPKDSPPILFASHATPLPGPADLKINVFLTSPDVLFSRQRARVFWFGALIAVSTVAALIGLLTAGRAFARQQRLHEMKSNFVSSVSHELRAPIASVRLLAEGLEKGRVQGAEKQAEYFRFIGRECRRLSSLIENVLDFSRIDQGRKDYEFELTDLNALVRQTAQLMEPAAVERQIELNVELPAEIVAVDCDGHAIEQALVNLIDNAIKHSPNGSRISVGLEGSAGSPTDNAPSVNGWRRRALDGSIQLWVQDEGEGIPEAEHERIFERFYRVGSELRRQTQGIGIGLAIVKHIIEGHRGSVRVESSPGQGSRFVIDLPAGGRGCGRAQREGGS